MLDSFRICYYCSVVHVQTCHELDSGTCYTPVCICGPDFQAGSTSDLKLDFSFPQFLEKKGANARFLQETSEDVCAFSWTQRARPCEQNLLWYLLNIPAIFTGFPARISKQFRLIIELPQLSDKEPIWGCTVGIYDALKVSASHTHHSFLLWRQPWWFMGIPGKQNTHQGRRIQLNWMWNGTGSPLLLLCHSPVTVRPLSDTVMLPERSTVTFAHSQPHLHHLASVQTPLTARCPPYRQRSETAGGVADGFFRRTECDKMTKSRAETLSDGSPNPSLRRLTDGSYGRQQRSSL